MKKKINSLLLVLIIGLIVTFMFTLIKGLVEHPVDKTAILDIEIILIQQVAAILILFMFHFLIDQQIQKEELIEHKRSNLITTKEIHNVVEIEHLDVTFKVKSKSAIFIACFAEEVKNHSWYYNECLEFVSGDHTNLCLIPLDRYIEINPTLVEITTY